MLRLYSAPIFSEKHLKRVAQDLKTIDENLYNLTVKCEACYYVVLKTGTNEEMFLQKYRKPLEWLLAKPIGQSYLDLKPVLEAENDNQCLIEIGPRFTFTTAFSTNAVSSCRSAGMASITRLERSLRYLVTVENGGKIDQSTISKNGGKIESSTISKMAAKLHDQMTECCYETPPETFDSGIEIENVREIDVLSAGGLEKANPEMGLAFDAWDMEYYRKLFREKVGRNPTDVELFDLAQSNSEHCRHWFFKGKMLLDGQEEQKSLFQMVMDTQNTSNPNNVIKFCDNSSGIEGFQVEYLLPENGGTSSELIVEGGPRHIIYTAETHNFPTVLMLGALVLLMCFTVVDGRCSGEPCLNGGTCYDVLYQPDIPTVCICPECYGGDRCENREWCPIDFWLMRNAIIGSVEENQETDDGIPWGAIVVFSGPFSLGIAWTILYCIERKYPSGKYPQQELKKRNAPEPSPSEQTTQPSSVADDQGLTSESTQKSDTY